MNRLWVAAAAAGLLLCGVAIGELWRRPPGLADAPAGGVPEPVSFKTAPRVDAMKQAVGVVSRQDAMSQLSRYAFLYKDNPAVSALLADVQKKPELRELFQASRDGRKSDEAVQRAAGSPAMMDLLDKHTFQILGAVVGSQGHNDAAGRRGVDFIPQAVFHSQKVPLEMISGRSYSVSVVMANVGNTVWSKWDGYALGSENPEANMRWGRGIIEMGGAEKVAPGEKATFTFSVTAPAEPGRYDFQWRMCKMGVKWFGLLTPNVTVSVAAPP